MIAAPDSSKPTELDRSKVLSRKVFYIPGYDPHPARRYRELYRTESARQAEISGYSISQSGGARPGRNTWHVEFTDGSNSNISTDIEVLEWADLVQSSMTGGIAATYRTLLRTVWIYVSSGAISRLAGLRKGPVIAALYPVIFLLFQFIIALSFGTVACFIALSIARTASNGPGSALTGWGLGLNLGAVVAVAVLIWFRKLDGRFLAYYLMQDFAYSAALRGRSPDALQRRLQGFGRRIHDALNSTYDEVLVVGHSSGVHLAIEALAPIVRDGGLRGSEATLSFLSLGHVVPMVSFLPEAHDLRRDLRDLSLEDELTWVDVSAPGDGCSFALCDPVAVSGVATPGKKWPLVISARFSQTLSESRWKSLRWRFFRLHFQYLCAFDRPGIYDYFQITAGPLTLAQRFEGHAPSPSRIEAARSGYRSVSQ